MLRNFTFHEHFKQERERTSLILIESFIKDINSFPLVATSVVC